MIGNNNLTGNIPPNFFSKSNLKYVNIQRNQLSGAIPDDIGLAVNLGTLEGGYNQLTSIPASINNCTSLSSITLVGNGLVGELPSLSALINLRDLVIHNNQLSGSPFEAIRNCTSLTRLYLGINNFSGPIPEYFGDLINLQNVYLSFNDFSGPLPESIGNFINLTSFAVRGCGELTGPIPDVFHNFSKLNQLDLSMNKFEGSLPGSICGTPIQYIDFGSNNLSGSIPECYGDLYSLRNFNIPGNLNTSGSVPVNFKNLLNLNNFSIKQTGISSIPEFKYHPNKSSLSLDISVAEINPADIEKNLDSANTHSFKGFVFRLQSYGGETYYEVDINDSLLIEAIPGGVNAIYTWEKYDSVNFVYVDVTSLNESTDLSKFLLNTPDTTDFGHYRAIIENSWIPQIFNSGPIIVNPYTGNTIYAIKSGDWHDPSLWSATENGSSLNTLPRNKDSVIIKGHVVNVLQSTSYYDAALLQDPLNETGLVLRSGTMTVTGNIRLGREGYKSPVYFQVVEQGNVEVVE